MAAMETLSEAMARLTAAGYAKDFYAAGGRLVCGGCAAGFEPVTMDVDEIVRFEGASDPDDQAMLFALTTDDGHRGLYAVAYGPNTPLEDSDVLAALPAVIRDHPPTSR